MLRFLSGQLPARTGPAISENLPAPELPASGRRKGRRRDSEFTSYYGRPVLKKPHWVWPIWLYFWIGGISGGVSAITAFTELVGDKERDRSIIRAGRYISLAGMMVSPVLLIIDLQRPERFHHMLRIVKFRSPLNIGTYILTTTGILSGINAARQLIEDGLFPDIPPITRAAFLSSNPVTKGLQGLDGMALGTYTGVLLSSTAVPLWIENDHMLAPLFLSSAFSTGAAAITLARALSGVEVEELRRLRGIEEGAIASELALIGLGAVQLKPEIRKAAFNNKCGALFGVAVMVGQVLPLLTGRILPKKGQAGRLSQIINSLLVLSGGLMLRIAVIETGKKSVEDPAAYHAANRDSPPAGK